MKYPIIPRMTDMENSLCFAQSWYGRAACDVGTHLFVCLDNILYKETKIHIADLMFCLHSSSVFFFISL